MLTTIKTKWAKGIILAGGKATRLHPITKSISKQLLPVYDKPMVYYPLSTLMLSGIRDILLISTEQAIPQFRNLLSDGSDLGISIQYMVQEYPRGLAEALIIGEEFIAGDRVCLILGDNIFFGSGLSGLLKEASSREEGATILGYYVKDPQRYGVVEFNKDGTPFAIEEKPVNPKSNWAVTGCYFYDQHASEIAKTVKPSARGELEITDVNRVYLNKKKLKVARMGRGYAWLDTGTYESLIDAAMFIKTIEDRQGLKIGCIEEVAYRMGFIDREQLRKLSIAISTGYGDYLKGILDEE
ncbi:MAG: glucose-1-phosphate thymidylyltransferase RfbA [Candidatus Omnitrophota bacterium]|jgi:glucose-1-phosphate thymidylyltransferase